MAQRHAAVIIQQDSNIKVADFATDRRGEPQRTWSVAKSIAATLVGAAVKRGEVDVQDSVGLGLDADDPRRAITIDHALRMASGRYSDTPSLTMPSPRAAIAGNTSVSCQVRIW